MAKRKTTPKVQQQQWYNVDLHLHTPASIDYQNPEASYLDILKRAEAHGLAIMAFTDHNTVNGYARMMHEIEQLTVFQESGRATKEEQARLNEYRRLLDKILVLPGFEFTATFGFHILGIFPPTKSIRELEHLLLSLNVPMQSVDEGNSEVGASSDVLTAYQAIRRAGGIVIAAHVNAAHGVAMRGLDFGGQTRIAYTQDLNLHALEVTDLGSKGRQSTARFFNGIKSEYPRKMRCIQGSDAHALDTITDRRGKVTTLGVGERTTEMQLRERSFEALVELFESNDFSRSRPFEGNTGVEAPNYVLTAREEGESIVQAFHEMMQRKGGSQYSVVADVCAFANTNGGTVYVGLSKDPTQPVVGITEPVEALKELEDAVARMITPELHIDLDTLEADGKTIVRVQVPRGGSPPYVVDEYKIYVRGEDETNLAVRDEIVGLVKRGMSFADEPKVSKPAEPAAPIKPVLEPLLDEEDTFETNPIQAKKPRSNKPAPVAALLTEEETPAPLENGLPRAGVEIIGTEQRNGTGYFIMRDLRNGNIVHNVTKESARRLWHYAILQQENNPLVPTKIHWSAEGDIGLWRHYKRGTDVRYDLVMRAPNGKLRVFYGVSEAGMDGRWQQFLEPDEEIQ
ncbi:MAG: RNA-binding domain-containing protein [Phototrophicaceae bacterium]